MMVRVGWVRSWCHSRTLPVFSSKTDAALLMVQAEEAQWVMKADEYLRLEAWAGVTDCALWDLVQEETGVWLPMGKCCQQWSKSKSDAQWKWGPPPLEMRPG